VGAVVEGRYRVLDQIGRGGMGEVYKVEHVRMGKIAAMKLLHPELARESEVVARFQREAKAVSRLSHPHTVQVFDFGEHDGALFLVMEYVKGRDLGSLAREEGAIAYQRAVPMIVQLCLALEEAHDAGIVHRDVKPENVLVSRGTDGADYIKVLDFGLAQLREGADQGNITAKGNVIGTPYYMAPEQIRGEQVDHRCDIYAIGATLYRLVTGVVPFPAKTPVGVLTKCLTEPLEPLCARRPDLNLPAELEAVVMKAMAKDPAERHGSTRELRKALQGCLASLRADPVRVLGGTTSDPYSQSSMPGIAVASSPFTSEHNLKRADLDHFEKRLRRRRRLSVLLPLLVLLLGGAALAWYFTRPAPVSHALKREKEPNHTNTEANLIARGHPVKGQIGKRLSETQSDVDTYTFEVKAAGPVLLSARLSGIPFINTSLQIYDEDGVELAAVDNGPARSPEILPNLVVSPGRYFAVAQEVATERPGTNVNDWYELRVSWRPLKVTDEVEPNDAMESANQIVSGETVEGYLAREDDVDVFRPEGRGGGAVSVTLLGAKQRDLRLRVVGLDRTSVATADKDDDQVLARRPLRAVWQRVADDGRTGEGETLKRLPWLEGQPAPLIIVEASPRARFDPARVDRPYKLQYTFHRGATGTLPAQRPPPRRAARDATTGPGKGAAAAPAYRYRGRAGQAGRAARAPARPAARGAAAMRPADRGAAAMRPADRGAAAMRPEAMRAAAVRPEAMRAAAMRPATRGAAAMRPAARVEAAMPARRPARTRPARARAPARREAAPRGSPRP
jgi:serine/threonine-protein kinase